MKFREESYTTELLASLDEEDFPLLHDMCRKNEYGTSESVKIMSELYADSEPLAVAVYRDKWDEDTATTKRRVLVLEVNNSKHLLGLGKKMLDELKWDCEEIRLGYVHESKEFYRKNGFVESGENEMRWRRDD